jgi:hypothetical protein
VHCLRAWHGLHAAATRGRAARRSCRQEGHPWLTGRRCSAPLLLLLLLQVGGGVTTKDLEGAPMSGDDAIEQTVAELSEAVQALPAGARQEIVAHLDAVQAAAQSLSRVSATLNRKSQS